MFPIVYNYYYWMNYLLWTIPSIPPHRICCNIFNANCAWSMHLNTTDVELPALVYFVYAFSPLDLMFFCALLQTQLNGPLVSFLMKSRESPMQILAMIAAVIIALVFVTVLISMVSFMRNKKSNKILPSQRIIRKKHRQRKRWNFHNPFKQQNNSERFMKEVEVPENVNYNNNSVGLPHALPLPPPLPSYSRLREQPWAVPSISATVAKRKSFRNKQKHINTALVSELKLRLEQKKLMNQY